MAETFTSLKLKVAQWMMVESLTRFPDSVRGDCVNMAIRFLLKKYELRYGENSDEVVVTAGDHTYEMPDRFIKFYDVCYLTGGGAHASLAYLGRREYNARYPDPSVASARAAPAHYSYWNDTFYLGPVPEGSLTLNRDFFSCLPDLSDTVTSNIFTDENWEAILWRALKRACKFLNDPGRIEEFAEEMREAESMLAAEHRREKSAVRRIIGKIPGSNYGGR